MRVGSTNCTRRPSASATPKFVPKSSHPRQPSSCASSSSPIPESGVPKLAFLVIGAARSGTTSLHHYLRRHPRIGLPANKEAPFFTTREEYAGGWPNFSERLFGHRHAHRLLGKVTPQYMAGSLYWARREAPWGDPAELIGTDDPAAAARIVPERIAAHNPGIKLVAVLRDPVERAISHYRHAVRQGWEADRPDKAFSRALHPEALARARLLPSESVSAYVTFGEYARILDGYRAVFGVEQLCLIPFEDLKADPLGVVTRVLGFLGLAEPWHPANAGLAYNASDSVARVSWLDTRRIERLTSEWQTGRRLWLKMPPRARRAVDELFARAASMEERYNRVSGADPTGAAYDRARAMLRAHYAPWNERLLVTNGPVRSVTEQKPTHQSTQNASVRDS